MHPSPSEKRKCKPCMFISVFLNNGTIHPELARQKPGGISHARKIRHDKVKTKVERIDSTLKSILEFQF